MRKYYYVQRATGISQWEVPTQPALSVPTPDPTPQPTASPFHQPTSASGTPIPGSIGYGGQPGAESSYQGTERSLLSVGLIANLGFEEK